MSESAEEHFRRGLSLEVADQWEAARDAYRQALGLRPGYTDAYNNLGNVLLALGEVDAAIAAYRQAAALAPAEPTPHTNLGMALLLKGEFQKGWREYEWRRKVAATAAGRRIAAPAWDGSNLRGRRIVLHPEQGFGDTIQFARYAPLVAQRGGSVVLACQQELARLLRSIPELERVVTHGEHVPAHDLQCALPSLPAVLKTDLASIPASAPYLYPDAALSAVWRARLAGHPGLKVGLAWAGKTVHRHDRRRSVALAQLASLREVSGVQFVSLQKRSSTEQIPLQSPLSLIDWTAELADFADAAALVANLDLVITVDTAAAHLAGALGKPVWVLLPAVPDWRWMLGRTDSPWYPTMRLFRQSTPGDWIAPVRQITGELGLLSRRA